MQDRRKNSIVIGIIATLSSFFVVARTAANDFELSDFIEQHCHSCHSGEAPDGNLDLKSLAVDFKDAELLRRWIFIHDRVAKGEMPPESEGPLEKVAKSKFLAALQEKLIQADITQRKIILRRLNKSEYTNTVRDLFGIYVDLQDVLPNDSVDRGFDTVGANLSLSTEQLLAYIEAADLVLDEAFGPPQAPRQIKKSFNMKDARSKGTADRILNDGVLLFSGAKSLPTYGASAPLPGTYRLTAKVKAVQTHEPVIMRIDGGVTGRVPSHVAGFFEVAPGKVTTIELTDRAVENSDTFAFALVNGFPWWSVGEDYKGAGLFIGDVTIEGPLEEWPGRSRKAILGEIDSVSGTLDDIRTILERIGSLAYRRPITQKQLDPMLLLAQEALDEGLSFEKALRRGLKRMLCSPEFLFINASVSEDAKLPNIDDFELAARMSYFLWSSLPDRELFELANRQVLHSPEVLAAQVERMLRDPKAERFVESFCGQWLKLRDIDFTVPNAQLYPEYNQLIRQSMLDETHSFFKELLDEDLSVRNFIDSDFVMLNQPLADFYGIEGVRGLHFRRVDLPEKSLRGGVLTQASVLKVSADGTRTSPVLRGAWILQNLFGTPAPPPPPTVAAIEPDIRGATTIREQLARHRSDPNCSRCHKQIDPPGFALESFDVIGGERSWYRTTNVGKYLQIPLHPQSPKHHVRYRQGANVDASGQLPDGRKFEGIAEYKQLLMSDKSVLAEPLTGLLMSYALGRNLRFSDRGEIQKIVAKMQDKDYGLRSIIHSLIASDTFRRP